MTIVERGNEVSMKKKLFRSKLGAFVFRHGEHFWLKREWRPDSIKIHLRQKGVMKTLIKVIDKSLLQKYENACICHFDQRKKSFAIKEL